MASPEFVNEEWIGTLRSAFDRAYGPKEREWLYDKAVWLWLTLPASRWECERVLEVEAEEGVSTVGEGNGPDLKIVE